MADLQTIITSIFAIIGMIWALLKIIAPITKWKGDDKILKIFNSIADTFNVTTTKSEIKIKIK